MKKSIWQAVKFTVFSASAGIIQAGSFTLMDTLLFEQYWIAYLVSLLLSIVWNFTLNRRFTFKAAVNVPVAMLKVLLFYLVFTPLSTWIGNSATVAGVNKYIVLAVTMLSNLVLEFLFCKFVVYKDKEDTI
ncbi:MAG: GtrA family protein [Clostridia bacterium]|nr:GtrA family protein [Clostridia bacterium]